ncbi:MAG TPA: chorismate synthase [Dehalococcoidia bacterium]|nr:chorismate synthase [Dehalococcoidia bacterium]
MHFRFLTAGESHGQALLVIVEGMPAGLELSEDYIAGHLRRRQQGYGRGKRQQIEVDRAELISGVRHGKTMGGPIGMRIVNRDWENANWQKRMSVAPIDDEVERLTAMRPGHTDLPGVVKYGLDDVRPVLERSSARETTARVAAAAVARRYLEEFGVHVHSHVLAVGEVWANPPVSPDWQRVEESPVRCADPAAEPLMIARIDAIKEGLDTIGGIFEVRATGVPMGLGSFVQWDRKLDGRLAQAVMSMQAVKGVEIGTGFMTASLPGSEVQDVLLPPEQWTDRPWTHASNRAGGLEGGVTNGEDVIVRGALKPISTLPRGLPTVDLLTAEPTPAFYERSDVCVVPAAGVIGEAMVAIVLADAVMEKFGGDNIRETLHNFHAYMKTIGPRTEGWDRVYADR